MADQGHDMFFLKPYVAIEEQRRVSYFKERAC